MMVGEEVKPHIPNIRLENLSFSCDPDIRYFLKPSKPIHDFSLVFSKNIHYLVVGCSDYPTCMETITLFSKRD